MWHRQGAKAGGTTMKQRLMALLLCGVCLATVATAQLQTTAPPPTSKAPCRDTPDSKTAWFDPSKYPLLGNGVKVGRAVSTPDPEYSEPARKAKLNGTVLLAVAVNASGNVDAVKVVCALEPGLDQNAANAVKQWKFTPATKDGEPVPVQIEVSVGYRLY
jgi:TonB family protein